jgi:hypothetical protein
MSVYVLTGKLGCGKSLLAVSKIREALRAGRRVATNLDLWLEKMLPPGNRTAQVLRVPDKPTSADLDAIGMGADVLDEERYGLLVLDELGSWANARGWGDKDRQAVIEWLIHSRKKRWDVLFLVQHESMIDKQIRDALMQYHVSCKRLDKIRVPFFGTLGWLLSLGAWNGRVGRVHLGVVVDAATSNSVTRGIVTDRWLYRGNALFASYDTEQVFSSTYPHGLYSYLPPWQVFGRYQLRALTFLQLARVCLAVLGVGAMGGWPLARIVAAVRDSQGRPRPPGPTKPREAVGGRLRGPQLRPVARAVRDALAGLAQPQGESLHNA